MAKSVPGLVQKDIDMISNWSSNGPVVAQEDTNLIGNWSRTALVWSRISACRLDFPAIERQARIGF